MSILGRERIISLLRAKKYEDRLIVTPLFLDDQVSEASIDIRLGNNFIITRKGNLAYIDPAADSAKSHRYQTKHYINFGNRFYLHPGELVLAGTLEYFRLPKTVAGSVTSRSSWGRTGLIIATATAVQPGFTGVITLELVNHGEVPLVLYPGLSVAQLILAECDGATEYNGRFSYATEAVYPRVSSDKNTELNFWCNSFKR